MKALAFSWNCNSVKDIAKASGAGTSGTMALNIITVLS